MEDLEKSFLQRKLHVWVNVVGTRDLQAALWYANKRILELEREIKIASEMIASTLAERNKAVREREEQWNKRVSAERNIEDLRGIMLEAFNDFHGKKVLFSSRYLEAIHGSSY